MRILFVCLDKIKKKITHIYNDHVGGDMTIGEFKYFCSKSWLKKHGFLVIDLSSVKYNGKYRRGFQEFYYPDSEV